MPGFISTFLGWYLGSWARLSRRDFGIILALATVPGIVMMVMGWGNSAGSFFEPLGDLSSMTKGMNGGDYQGGLNFMQGLADTGGNGGKPPVAVVKSLDWSALVNSLCLLAMVPLSRMRLRDMGWLGWQEMAVTVALNVSVVGGLVGVLTGLDILPFGFVWGVANFVGYAWLSMAKGGVVRKAPHEKVPDNWTPPVVDTPKPETRTTYLNHDPDE